MGINTPDIYEHLDTMDPKVKDILNIPVRDVEDRHLGQLHNRMKDFTGHENPDVCRASEQIMSKIENILDLTNQDKSNSRSEISQAVNNPYYRKVA